jgi:hypothetical protein
MWEKARHTRARVAKVDSPSRHRRRVCQGRYTPGSTGRRTGFPGMAQKKLYRSTAEDRDATSGSGTAGAGTEWDRTGQRRGAGSSSERPVRAS